MTAPMAGGNPISFRMSAEELLNAISVGMSAVDLGWNILYANQSIANSLGCTQEEMLAAPYPALFDIERCDVSRALRNAMENGSEEMGEQGYLASARRAARIPVIYSVGPLHDAERRIIGGIAYVRDLKQLQTLQLESDGVVTVGYLASRCLSMMRLLAELPAISASNSNVLILGETGTGKELLARTVHAMSSRKAGPFVAVNCAALPEMLMESELFGYKAGAFTGATRNKPGRFAQARGGTLFLDEVGEIPLSLQSKLLRVLQEKVYEPLGSTESETADVRIVAATNQDLVERMTARQFRNDLYFRLNVIKVEMPSLRDRKQDISLIASQFVEQFSRQRPKAIRGFSDEALAIMTAYDWPGNIRELENVVERAFVLCAGGVIEASHLPRELLLGGGRPQACAIRSSQDQLAAQAIRDALRHNQYNRAATAKELGIHFTTLFRRMKKLGIAAPDSRTLPPTNDSTPPSGS